jgi:serine/threonine-protein kinase RsbW
MGNIDAVCEQTSRYLCSTIKGIDTQLFAINLVIREGLTNAVRHGNAGDPQKKVQFILTCAEQSNIKLVIEDEGDGFDWKKQQSAACIEEEDHGRGIPIMGKYFTRYSYNEKGNILSLEKDLLP